MHCLACADASGNDLNLYSPLWMYNQESNETLLDMIKRRMESVLQRSKGLRNELQYYALCWVLAHIPAFRMALDVSKNISDIYKKKKQPESIIDRHLTSVDTAIKYEKELIEIFDRHSPASSPTSRLLGKGFKKSSSVRYVKQQITRQLQDSDNEFISFVMVTAVCGAYSDCKRELQLRWYSTWQKMGTTQ